MRVIILAGGLGTRLSEETSKIPKPMVEIGGKPLLWHIMRGFAHHGFTDFVICLGYKGEVIREYFANYWRNTARAVSLDLATGRHVYIGDVDQWNVTLVDTGQNAGTAERVCAVAEFLGDTFLLTYGDGVSDVDINALVKFHRAHGKLSTITTVQPESKLGEVRIGDDGRIESFREKPRVNGWINAGFMVMQREALKYLELDPYLESKPLESLARDRQLMAYQHRGHWACCDTMKDKQQLEALWSEGRAPWRR